MKLKSVWLACCALLLLAGVVQAEVIHFDDLDGSGTSVSTVPEVPAGYQGVTWGTTTDGLGPGKIASWMVIADDFSYSIPHSPKNCVYNAFGVNSLWFTFAGPVNFGGAWFAAAPGSYASASQVRFRDDLGRLSAWLDLAGSPQFLSADFIGARTIFVERQGGIYSDMQWFTMDDITYNKTTNPVPEPSSLLALMSGLPLAGFLLRRKRS